MELRFDGRQEHQLNAIDAVVDLFEGQPSIEASQQSVFGFDSIPGNQLDLDSDTLLKNLHKVQGRNDIALDSSLSLSTQRISTDQGAGTIQYHNFSVEMETGTGKTYVYIRTALELYQKYGFRKFIIVVPSIAIREGVLKTFQITETHLATLYDNLSYKPYIYDSQNLSVVHNFVTSPGLMFLVMTIDAFNTDINIIRRSTDRFPGNIPIHRIQAVRPILILDEPQTKLEGEKNIQALAELRPLLALRYSATHRNPHNLVYRLSPYQAYRQNLVKHVEIAVPSQVDDFNRAYIEVQKIERAPRTMRASLGLHKRMKSGTIKEKTVRVAPGDHLFDKTGSHDEYRDYVVTEITDRSVIFAVGGRELTVRVGESIGEDRDAIYAAQIEEAVKKHFRKQVQLKELDIKVLTLFFIDRVANYRDNGKLCRMFDEAFDAHKGAYEAFRHYQPAECRAAYFAKKGPRGKETLDDSHDGTAAKDRDAYDLIMRDKERLLSFEEKVSFIFSHSALNEGWDNPNIFQICTLRDVRALIARRQQIGRGIRLPVNQSGERVRDTDKNVLTVIANESFSKFVKEYQQELHAAGGTSDDGTTLHDARQRRTVKRTKQFKLSPEFKTLWAKISQKTRYSVDVDTERVIQDVVKALEDMPPIRAPRIAMDTYSIVLDDGNVVDSVHRGAATTSIDRKVDLPDITRRIADLLKHKQPSLSLSRRTVLAIVQRSGRLQDCMLNPQAFANLVAGVIRDEFADHLVDGIEYQRINEWYEMTCFEPDFDSWQDMLVRSCKSIYDHTVYDSCVERRFVQDMEALDNVHLYVKLPSWFKVRTPVGNYNPDWAVVMNKSDDDSCDKLYLVSETKGGDNLRHTEALKVTCGTRHFQDALGVTYRKVDSVRQLL